MAERRRVCRLLREAKGILGDIYETIPEEVARKVGIYEAGDLRFLIVDAYELVEEAMRYMKCRRK